MKTIFLIPVLALTLAGCDAATKPVAANQSTPAPATAAVAFPALTGRVVDRAELLTPAQEAGLVAELEALEARTTHQFVVVTVTDLGGRDIADYSRDLGNHWRIGSAGRNNGVLLVVAPTERRVRIEVGNGLTAVLTNQRAQEIIERDLVPQFRAGRWNDGILAGTAAIIATLTTAAANQKVPAR
jgi:uncharacterized protein